MTSAFGRLLTLRRDERAATAVEFAILVTPLMALILGSLQLSIIFYADEVLQTAAVGASRQLMTGYDQQNGVDVNGFQNAVCNTQPAPLLFSCPSLVVDVQSASSYKYLNTNPISISYDTSGKVIQGNYSPGTPGQIVIVRALYDWPVIAGPLFPGLANQTNGTHLLVGTSVFKTEPYSMSWRMQLSKLVRVLRDARGVAALEFALVVPAVIILYAGGYEIAQAATVNRKVTDTTVQLANVTSQYTTVADTDLAQIAQASTQIMDPAPVSPLTLTISEIQTDTKGSTTAKVVWSRQYTANTGSSQCGLSVGTTVTMPTGLPVPSQNYIFVQTSYTYQTTIGSAFISNLPMSDQIFMLPRESASVPCTSSDCFC